MTARAVAYIRKSVVKKGQATLSWEIQEAEVRALAARCGDELPDEAFFDWGVSGRGSKVHLRAGYRALREEIAAGRVTTVYAYSLSRLTRNIADYGQLAELCMAHGARLHLCKEGLIDFGSATGRMIVGILMVVAQMEVEQAQERTQDMIRARQARGDILGRKPYGSTPGEDVAAVVAAYERIGSWHGAARWLNTAGVPTRGGNGWRASSVRSVVLNQAPELAPVRRVKGVARLGTAVLARLLRCHCGQILTPQSSPSGIRYRCSVAADEPTHGLRSVAESQILPWIRDELARVQAPDEVLQVAEVREGRRAEVLELARRNVVAFQAQAIDDVEFLATKKALDTELSKLDAEGQVLSLAGVDWERDAPALINEWARGFVDFVQLDEAMRPVEAKWLLPEWRSPELQAA